MRIRRLAQPINVRGPVPPCPQCNAAREEVVGVSLPAWIVRLVGGGVILAGLGGGTYALIRDSGFAAWLVVFLLGVALVAVATIALRASRARYWNCPTCKAAQEIPPRVSDPAEGPGPKRKSGRTSAADPDAMDRL
jgi:hypothetical protein